VFTTIYDEFRNHMAHTTALPHISAPILYGCIFLGISWLILLGLMASSSQRLLKQIRRFSDVLPEATDKGHSRKLGLAEPELDRLRERTRVLGGSAQSWWQMVFEHIEQYEDASGEERSFLTEQPRHILPSENLLAREFNSSLFAAFPGLLTGAGLTLTFVAILLALGGVHYNKLNAVEPVQGIEQLINGLSGKLLSSIVALTLSIIFTVCERSVQRTLRQRYEKLLFALVDSIPVLSTKRILLDIRKSSAEASVSVSHVSSEVTDRLAAALNERVVPSLSAAMVNGITSRLMTIGVDAQTCKLIVLDRRIASMTEFKQIIGRGTRIREDYNKFYFTIMDFKRATALFADPDFDGDPVQIYEPGPGDPPTPPDDPQEAGEPASPEVIALDTIDPDMETGARRPARYYVNDVEVTVGADGKLITESL
jgi:hypothetical protein